MSWSACQVAHKGRGRDENPIISVFNPEGKLDGTDWQAHVQAIIRVERVAYTRDVRTGLLSRATETAFYVANRPLAASRAAQAIRAHWAIETTSHYNCDVALGEDRSRIHINPSVFARLRSFAFNILKANRSNTLN